MFIFKFLFFLAGWGGIAILLVMVSFPKTFFDIRFKMQLSSNLVVPKMREIQVYSLSCILVKYA